MIVDAFMYAGEVDLLEMRLNMLSPHVDRFVIGEAEITFSGKAKPLYFEQQQARFKAFHSKIVYAHVQNFYSPFILKYMSLLGNWEEISYPHLMAFYQKEYLQAGMFDLKDTDVVYYGDADEIWIPQQVTDEPQRLPQLQYSGFLNQRSNEEWKGTIVATYAKVKQLGLNQLREKSSLITSPGGWHFTNMGGLEAVQRKLNSYDHQEVNTDENHAKLEERLMGGKDFIGRDFKMWLDESEWPQYLKDNRAKYAHLCR